MNPLEQLNAIIGLCFKTTGWPDSLKRLGYMVERIELKFNVTDPTTLKQRTVNPDIVLCSDKLNSSLFFELKSGSPQVECKDQLERSSLVELPDVIQKAFVNSGNPDHHKFEMILLCNEKNSPEYKKLITDNSFKHPLISLSSEKIYLHTNNIKEVYSNEVFRKGIIIKDLYPTTGFVPILSDSKEEQIAEQVVTGVVTMIAKKIRILTIDHLMGEIFPEGLWQTFHTEAKKSLRKKVISVLEEMCNTEFKDSISKRGGSGVNPPEWILKNHPNNKNTLQFQGLKTKKVEYLSRISKGELYKGYDKNQDTIFALLEEVS